MEIPSLKKGYKWSEKKFVGEWGKALENYIHRKADKVPKGFLTGPQALIKMGLHGAAGGQRTGILKQMVDDGILVRKEFRIVDGSGRRLSSIVHYALAK
jgi:hypothetical protein